MSEQPKCVPGMYRAEEAAELRAAIKAVEEPHDMPARARALDAFADHKRKPQR